MRIKGMGVQICPKITPEIFKEMQRELAEELAEEEERNRLIEIPLPSSTESQTCSPWGGAQRMQMEG